MNNIDYKIECDKEKYLAFARANADKDIYIYGAGRMAKPLFLFFENNGVHIRGFAVQSKTSNKQMEYGVPIVQINEIDSKNTAVIFGVNERLNDEVERVMRSNHIDCYMKATHYLRYFGEYQYYFYTNPMVEITTQIGCAVNCKYCPQDILLKNYYKTGSEKKSMDLEMYKTCMDKLPPNTLIEFAGFTEPFFNPVCGDMIVYAKEKNFRINLFTTLRGVGSREFRIIQETDFCEFVLHVPDLEGYANIPINDKYIQMIDCLLDKKKQDGESFIDYICCQGTIHPEIESCIDGRARVFISLLDRAGNLKDEKLYTAKKPQGKIRCELSGLLNHNVLLPNGDLVLCAQDYALRHVLGNLLEQTYDDIINGDEVTRLMQAFDDNGECLCRECSLAYYED